jgi:hypothetical protein
MFQQLSRLPTPRRSLSAEKPTNCLAKPLIIQEYCEIYGLVGRSTLEPSPEGVFARMLI